MGTSNVVAQAPTPVYQQPPLDPAFAQLMADTQQQDITAMQSAAQSQQASLMARYGTLVGGQGPIKVSPLLAAMGMQRG